MKKHGGEVSILQSAPALLSALDRVEANLMIADTNLNLIFVNRHANATLASLDGEIRKAFRIGSNELLGGSIHRMHRDPARVERILKDPRSFPHRATLVFGQVKLAAKFEMVLDARGECCGYVVNWESVADREARAQQLSDELTRAAETLNHVSMQLSASAEEASAQANVVAAGAEELSASIREIATNVNQASTVAHNAMAAAQDSSGAIAKLGDSSVKIGEVVKLIASIAAQTNLLALNATIEAARAGDAGRGFAVVANEVKELAKQTGTATDEIGSMVQTIQGDVTVAVDAIRRINEVIDQINGLQGSIAAAVDQQTATANEIAGSVVSVADASKDTAQVAVQISSMSTDLDGRVGELRGLLLAE